MRKALVISFLILAGLIIGFTFIPVSGEMEGIYNKYILTNSYVDSIDMKKQIELERARLEATVSGSGLILFTFPFNVGSKEVYDGDIFNTWGKGDWRKEERVINGITRKVGKHGGSDLSVEGHPEDVEVLSMVNGRVKKVGETTGGGGNVVIIVDDVTGLNITYMHIKDDSFKVETGDTVRAGQPVAIMGSTGTSTAVHLHVSVTYPGTDLAFETTTEGKITNGLDMFDPKYFAYSRESFPENFKKNSDRKTDIIVE